jgi:hypothetical protein
LGSVGGVILLAAAVALVVLIKLHKKAKAARYKSFFNYSFELLSLTDY